MDSNSREARERAAMRLDRMQKAAKDGEKARALYDAAGQATRDKTARLRELRLAKEAADAAAAVEKKKPAGKKAKAKV